MVRQESAAKRPVRRRVGGWPEVLDAGLEHRLAAPREELLGGPVRKAEAPARIDDERAIGQVVEDLAERFCGAGRGVGQA
jgi:hypothetical protein